MADILDSTANRLVALGFLYRSLLQGYRGLRAFDERVVRESQRLISSAAFLLGGVTSAVNSLFLRVENLRAAAKLLVSSNGNGVFAKKDGFSSDPDLVAVSVENGAEDDDFHISVSETAQTQRNVGTEIVGSDLSDFIPAGNFFTVTSDTSTETVSFEVEKIGGNRTALLEIAQQINNAQIGVTAKVVNDDDDFRLILRSDASGAAGGFTVADLAGNAVSASGMDTVVIAAQDAVFAVNGLQAAAASNTLTLQDSLVQVDLLQPTRQLVRIEIRSNPELVLEAVTDFIGAFNDTLAFLSNGTFAQALRAKNALGEPIRANLGELSEIGITQDRFGHLSIDEDTFISALRSDPDRVEAFIGGPEGIAAKLAGELEDIGTAPVGRLPSPFGSTSTVASIVSALTSPGFALDVSA